MPKGSDDYEGRLREAIRRLLEELEEEDPDLDEEGPTHAPLSAKETEDAIVARWKAETAGLRNAAIELGLPPNSDRDKIEAEALRRLAAMLGLAEATATWKGVLARKAEVRVLMPSFSQDVQDVIIIALLANDPPPPPWLTAPPS
jgi:hypothetical protein